MPLDMDADSIQAGSSCISSIAHGILSDIFALIVITPKRVDPRKIGPGRATFVSQEYLSSELKEGGHHFGSSSGLELTYAQGPWIRYHAAVMVIHICLDHVAEFQCPFPDVHVVPFPFVQNIIIISYSAFASDRLGPRHTLQQVFRLCYKECRPRLPRRL